MAATLSALAAALPERQPLRHAEEVGRRHAEAVGELAEDAERRVDLAALDRADVVAMQRGVEAERLLREAGDRAQLPDGAAQRESEARRLLGIAHYGGPEAYPPITPAAFEFLYQAVHSNLRDAMAYAQQFSDWMYAEYVLAEKELPDETARRELLEIWMAQQAEAAQVDARVQPRVWQFFDELARKSGRRASDWEEYGFSTQQQLVRTITDLVSTNLLIRETDPENASRSFAALTPQGWLVAFHRNGYKPIV